MPTTDCGKSDAEKTSKHPVLKKGYKSIRNIGRHHSRWFQTNSMNKFSKPQELLWKTQLLLHLLSPHLGSSLSWSFLAQVHTILVVVEHIWHFSSCMARWIQIHEGQPFLQHLAALGGRLGSLPPHGLYGLHGLLVLHGLHSRLHLVLHGVLDGLVGALWCPSCLDLFHGAFLDAGHGNSSSSGTTGEARNGGSKLGKLRWLHMKTHSGAGSVEQIQSSWSWLLENTT